VFATEEHLVIVTDYAAAGNLADRVEDGGAVPEARGKEYFRQLVDGMVYCHKYNTLIYS
jgi:serine/threonine protein kinase